MVKHILRVNFMKLNLKFPFLPFNSHAFDYILMEYTERNDIYRFKQEESKNLIFLAHRYFNSYRY